MADSVRFGILIPSWNNLPYLKLCIEFIRENSKVDHELIVHVNEGTDGTIHWLEEQGITHTYTEENVGVCKAMNLAFAKSTQDYIVYMNDDMLPLPGWDEALSRAIEEAPHPWFMLSGTMIEPVDTGNKAVIVHNFGQSLETLAREELRTNAPTRGDWSGASWPPVLITRKAWEAVGGFSEEFSPGFYSDPDLSMKLWQRGCRYYRGVGDSRVYHFQKRSTGRVKANDGRKVFIKKWGLSAKDFYKHYLHMGERFEGAVSGPSAWVKVQLKVKGWIRRLVG